MPRIETVLEIMIHYRTKHIPVSQVYLRKLVTGISLCQFISVLVCTNDILRVSMCQKLSIMRPIINVQRSVAPPVTTVDHTDLYIFSMGTSILVCPSVCTSRLLLLSYLYT